MSAFTTAAAKFAAEHEACEVGGVVRDSHNIEGAEYNTGSANAYSNNSGRVYVSLMCKRCGIEAEYDAAPDLPVTKPAGCPETIDGTHYVEWVTRPPMNHNGQQVSGEERRGICAWCDERFIEQADNA